MSTLSQPLSPAAILDLIHRNSIGNVHDVPVFSRSLHAKIQPRSVIVSSVPPVVRSRSQQEALAIPGVRGGPNRRQTFGLSQTSGVLREDPTLIRDVPSSDGLVAFLRERAERERSVAMLRLVSQPAVVSVIPVVVAKPFPVVDIPQTSVSLVVGTVVQSLGHMMLAVSIVVMRWIVRQDLPTRITTLAVAVYQALGKGMQGVMHGIRRGALMLASRSAIGAYGIVVGVRIFAHGLRAFWQFVGRTLRRAIHQSIVIRTAIFRRLQHLDFTPLEFAVFAAIERIVFFIPRTFARIMRILIPRIFAVLRLVVRRFVWVAHHLAVLVRGRAASVLRAPIQVLQSPHHLRLGLPTRKRMTWAVGQAFTISALVLTLMTVGPIVRLQAGSWWEQLRYTLTGKANEPAIRENLLDAVRPPEVIPPEDKQFQLVIPKINANMKVIANVDAGDETEYTAALKKGVAHAKGSNLPGETEHGNRTIYIFGHSTNAVWNIEKYNALFYSLKDMVPGDDVSVWFWGKEYHYTVKEVVKIDPSDVHYLLPQEDKDQLILQTCWPPGTTWKRLLVIAEPKGN